MYKKFLGAYKDIDSPVYALHPFTKLSFTLSFVVAAGLVRSFAVAIALILILFIGGAAAKIYPPELLRVLKPFRFLLVFMFDRISRIDDETPFVVEWFVKHGIDRFFWRPAPR